MLISLSSIKPSPHPVRTSWDEDKMNELAQSIKEQGLIVPIKVRPMCPDHGNKSLKWEYNDQWPDYSDEHYVLICDEDHDDLMFPFDLVYEIIYGHRRVEACRRAGLTEIEAIVEEVDDGLTRLLQALGENTAREKMPTMDLAKGIEEIQVNKPDWSNRKIAKQLGMGEDEVRRLSALLLEPLEIQELAKESKTASPKELDLITKTRGLDTQTRLDIAEKVNKEGLSVVQSRNITKAVKAAKDESEKKAILETEYEHVVTMPAFIKAKAEAKRQTAKREKKKREEEPREVAKYLDAIRAFRGEVEEAIAVAKFGKFSPEAARFVKNKHDSLRKSLSQLEEQMEV